MTANLTEAETLVIRYILGGFSDKETARLLKISYRTVQTHRLNARRKIKAYTMRDLIVTARALGIQAV